MRKKGQQPDANDELILKYLAKWFILAQPSGSRDIANNLAMPRMAVVRKLVKLQRWGWVRRIVRAKTLFTDSTYWVITRKGAEVMVQEKNQAVFLTALDIWDALKGYE